MHRAQERRKKWGKLYALLQSNRKVKEKGEEEEKGAPKAILPLGQDRGNEKAIK